MNRGKNFQVKLFNRLGNLGFVVSSSVLLIESVKTFTQKNHDISTPNLVRAGIVAVLGTGFACYGREIEMKNEKNKDNSNGKENSSELKIKSTSW